MFVDEQRASKKRWQFLLLLLLLVPVGYALSFLVQEQSRQGKTTSASNAQRLEARLLNSHSGPSYNGAPLRSLPHRFQQQGTVDDRYTVAVDPETGATIIHDALGGVGTNNTSVEGDRAKLAKDMVALEEYANQNRRNLKPEAYSWLKKMARAGMSLAFGTPGLPVTAQPPIKQALLAEFHDISANPGDSVMHSNIFLEAERAAQSAEVAYQQVNDYTASLPSSSTLLLSEAGLTSNFLSPDPVSPIYSLNTWNDPSQLSTQVPLVTASSPTTASTLSLNSPTLIATSPTLTSTSSSTLVTDSTALNTTLAPSVTTVANTPTTTNPATGTLTTASPATSGSTSLTNLAPYPTSGTLTTTATAPLDQATTSLSSTATPITSATTTTSISPTLTTTSPTLSLTGSTTSTSTTMSTTTSTTNQTTVQDYYNTVFAPAK